MATLEGVVHAHVRTVPFENLDVQFGLSLSTDPAQAFAKLVERRRGGWCYEHNGVLGAALAAIGFPVTRISAGVMREVRGDEAMGSHLALLVECEGLQLVDAGFGSWIGAPLPLTKGEWMQPPLPIRLGQTDDGMWRLSVALGEQAMSYDFRPDAADEDELSRLCHWQCNDPASVFVQNLAVQRRDGNRYLMLRGKVLSQVTQHGEERRELCSADELVTVLNDLFGLDTPEAAQLWPAICARHDALFSDQAIPTT
jgi:N-hydroxyarylamine O-acetyltransferase